MKKLLVLLLCVPMFTYGQQTFIPGQSYFGQNNYVEYIAGNLPIIIVVPHGGTLTPVNLAVIHNRGVDNGHLKQVICFMTLLFNIQMDVFHT